MNTNNLFNFHKIIFLSTFLYILKSVLSLYFNYPTSIRLKNGNIFIIHQSGITITDANFTKIINNSMQNEIISSEEDLSKVKISEFEDGFFLCTIINQLYIFDYNGIMRYKMDIIDEDQMGDEDIYYDITPHKIENNDYYYLVSYIYGKLMYLEYYIFDKNNQTNILNASLYGLPDIQYNKTDNTNTYYYIQNKGLTCQFLIYHIYELLICLFTSSQNYFSIALLEISNSNIDQAGNFEHYSFSNSECIKSAKGSNPSTILSCLYMTSGIPICFCYDINSYLNSYWSFHANCRDNFYALKVDYFPEKEEYIFSCLMEEGGIQAVRFDKYFNVTSQLNYSYRKCEYIYGYSILYSNILNEYYILSDLKCNNTEYPFNLFHFTDLDIENEFEEENQIKEEEEGKNENEREINTNIEEKNEKIIEYEEKNNHNEFNENEIEENKEEKKTEEEKNIKDEIEIKNEKEIKNKDEEEIVNENIIEKDIEEDIKELEKEIEEKSIDEKIDKIKEEEMEKVFEEEILDSEKNKKENENELEEIILEEKKDVYEERIENENVFEEDIENELNNNIIEEEINNLIEEEKENKIKEFFEEEKGEKIFEEEGNEKEYLFEKENKEGIFEEEIFREEKEEEFEILIKKEIEEESDNLFEEETVNYFEEEKESKNENLIEDEIEYLLEEETEKEIEIFNEEEIEEEIEKEIEIDEEIENFLEEEESEIEDLFEEFEEEKKLLLEKEIENFFETEMKNEIENIVEEKEEEEIKEKINEEIEEENFEEIYEEEETKRGNEIENIYEKEIEINKENEDGKEKDIEEIYEEEYDKGIIKEKEYEITNIIIDNLYDICIKEQKKFISEKNICIDDCSKDDTYFYEFKNKCYNNCPQGATSSNNNEYFCELKCPQNSAFEIVSSNECVDNCSSLDFFDNKCKLNIENNTLEDNLIDDIQENIQNGKLISNKSKVIQNNNSTYQISPLKNQDEDGNNNVSTIDIGDCEYKLREKYNIPENEDLVIFKIDVYKEGYNMPVVEYEIYRYKTGEKLDLEACKDMKINLSVPVNIDENNLEKYNPNSSFYNDQCYTYTSESGTDVSLEDRKNEYIENNMTLCEEDCEYIGYDYNKKKALCKCIIKLNLFKISEITIDKTRLYDNFVNIPDTGNFWVMECYNILFTKEGFSKNIGAFILIPVIFLEIFFIIYFYIKDYKIIKSKIKEIIYIKKNLKNNNDKKNLPIIRLINRSQNRKKTVENKLNINKDKIEKDRKNKEEYKKINELLKKHKNKNLKNINKSNEIKNINKIKNNFLPLNTNNIDISKINKKKGNPPPIKKIKKAIYKTNKKINVLKTNDNLSDKAIRNVDISHRLLIESEKRKQFQNINKENNNLNNKLKIEKNVLQQTEYELNILQYKDAILIDKRTYIEYYFSLLKINHLLMIPFRKNDYNSFIIKIYLIFFSFVLYYAVNALFFDDKVMHKIYEDEGEFNFIYQIPQIIYSSIISSIIHALVKTLALTERNFIELKKERIIANLDKKGETVMNTIKNKFICFFILIFCLILFFWYYISCFCAVYKNTQVYLIKDTVICFGLSLTYSLGFYLIPGIFRIPSLRDTKKNREYLYKFSKIIQIL